MGFDGYIEFKGIHVGLAVLYLILAISFGLATFFTYGTAFSAPIENPPKGPIAVWAEQQAPLNNTWVSIDIPKQTITIDVSFSSASQPENLSIWAMLPYTISSINTYPILDGNTFFGTESYPLSNIGNLSPQYNNKTRGSSILNVTLDLNQTTFPHFIPNQRIGIEVFVHINDSLIAIDDSTGGSKTAIYTFFGQYSEIWTDDMIPYMGINSQPTSYGPFTVQIIPPSSYYYSSSQPPPVEYYVNNKVTGIMFSIDFLGGRYAQTLVSNFENNSAQSTRQLYIFLVGVFVTSSITFVLESVKEFMSSGFKYVRGTGKPATKTNLLEGQNNLGNINKNQKKNGEAKDPETLKEKMDVLLSKFAEDQQGRKQERFLSRIDGLYNVLLTLSIFLISLFISQHSSIAINPILSFPIISAIIAMLISFVIGLHGVLRDKNEIRILAWSLLVSCLIWAIAISGLVISAPFLNQSVGIQTTTVIAVIPLFIIDFILTKYFTKWLEKIFASKKLEVITWEKIGLLNVTSVIIIGLGIVIALIVFLIQLQLL